MRPNTLNISHLFLLLINLFFNYPPAFASLAATHLLVTHVGPCEGSVRTIVGVKELTITTQTYDSTLSGEFNVTEDVEDGWNAKATMQKCQDIRNTDTCDHFSSSWVVRDGCRDDDEEIYSMLFHYATPELECPIRAGTYNLDNYPFFTEDNLLTVYESKISTSVFGYTFRLDGYTADKRHLFCIEAYLQLQYMRDRNWIGNKKTRNTTPTPNDEDQE